MEFGIELIAPVPGEVVTETIMFETPFNEIPHVFINTRSSTPQNVYATAGDIKPIDLLSTLIAIPEQTYL